MLVICDETHGRKYGLKPMMIISRSAVVGCDPALMGMGPVHATRKVTNGNSETYDAIELNEAFAAQALACMRELGFDEAKVNADGGAIALGHPIGASGARLLVHLAHRRPRRGLATLCVGGGMGYAVVLEQP
jgi:acetyl-CoA C-acetyltransferase